MQRRAREAEELKTRMEQEQVALEEYIKFAQEEAQKNEIKIKEKEEIKRAVEREKQRKKVKIFFIFFDSNWLVS